MNTVRPALRAIADYLARHRIELKRGDKLPKTFKPQRHVRSMKRK